MPAGASTLRGRTLAMKYRAVPPFGRTVYFYKMEMYFIALVAPEEINIQVLKWKHYMLERFECSVALKSPAHITIVSPFWMDPLLEKQLTISMDQFCLNQYHFPIRLKNFSCFKPRVIFVSPEKNDALQKIQKNAEDFFLAENKFPIKVNNRPFHPHVTIASRDLHKKAFLEAWTIFENKKYKAEWIVKDISLLKHNKKNWDVVHTSQLNK